MNPDITDTQREFIMNQLRNFFKQEDTLLTKKQVTDSFDSLNLVFSVFFAIIGAISLTIAFFLLWLSMTQNIESAIWEYGVLRSIGLKQDEGRRLYMYEAFAIVVSSSCLGIIVGFLVSLMIASQFYMFIELPVKLFFPYYTLSGMLVMAVITTYISVYKPMKEVNKRRIANVLKAGGS